MALSTSYGTGQYAADGHTLLRRAGADLSNSRLCLYAWGRGNNAATALNRDYWLGVAQDVAKVGIPSATADYGSSLHWGNGTAVSRMTSLRTFANSQLSPRTDKVVLLGVSMGALLACNWAYANLSQVAAIALVSAALDPTASVITTPYGSEITTAFGGVVPASSNPSTFGASFSSIPVKVWYGNDDTTAPYSQASAFISASGAQTRNMGNVGHWAAAETAEEVARFLRDYA